MEEPHSGTSDNSEQKQIANPDLRSARSTHALTLCKIGLDGGMSCLTPQLSSNYMQHFFQMTLSSLSLWKMPLPAPAIL